MLLLLEIWLTITAWRKGYKALALIPLGLAVLIGFSIGLNNPELAENGDAFSFVWIDILAIVVLGIMIALAKTSEEDVHETAGNNESVSTLDAPRELPASQPESELN